MILYVGTYTGSESKGIYAYKFDTATGEITSLGLAAETANPSFLAIHPNQRFVYSVNEASEHEGRPTGTVSAFAVDRKSGKLTLLNRVESGGGAPCHLVVDKGGRYVLAANYGGGSLSVLPILRDGSLGKARSVVQHTGSSTHPKRQTAPHAHSINLAPDGKFAIVADLGIDRLITYRFDSTRSSLSATNSGVVRLEGGAGPRHFAFHPNGRFGYVINELNSTVVAFAYDAASGTLRKMQSLSSLPDGFSGDNFPAEIVVHPSGRFVYASNRGHDSIAVFRVDTATGSLTLVEHVSVQGKWPRNFNLDPSGAWLLVANQNSNNVVVFGIDQDSGRLKPTGRQFQVHSPTCIKFVPAN